MFVLFDAYKIDYLQLRLLLSAHPNIRVFVYFVLKLSNLRHSWEYFYKSQRKLHVGKMWARD